LAFEEDPEIFKALLEPLIPTSICASVVEKRKVVQCGMEDRAEKKLKLDRVPSCE
jgi:hypothetical protein